MERRKAELAAKRAKLDELRKAREQREARTASGSLASSVSHTPARSLSTATEGRAGLDDLVSSLLGDTRDKEREEDASGRVEGEGSVETDEVGRVGGAGSESMGPRTAGVSEGCVSLRFVV
jgi:dynein intermediate chain